MKVVILIFAFVFMHVECLCQTGYKITGTVIDSESKEAIPYVYVKLSNSKKYYITDGVGKFNFYSPNKNLDFSFEHLNYNKIAVKIDTLKKTTAELILVFELQKIENTLDEVIVFSKKELTNITSNIIDYDFIENKIVILNYKVPPLKSEIILLNEQLDTLNLSKLHFKPQSLYKDCFGNIHVLSTDSSYQIAYINMAFYLYKPYSISELEKKLSSCHASNKDFVYFIEKRGSIMITNTIFHPFPSKNNALGYFYINKLSKKRGLLFDVVDKKHDQARKQDSNSEKLAKAVNASYISPTVFRETIVLDEIYAPLFVVNDSIIIFDFINDEINVYQNNSVIFKKSIEFHRSKNWKRLMLFDEFKRQTYAKYIEKDKLTIKEINYVNGNVGKSYILPTFCSNLKIMNGNAYFLTKNSTNFNLVLNRVFLQ